LARLRAANPGTYDVKIDSQPLGAALQEFAKESGVQVILFPGSLTGLERTFCRHGLRPSIARDEKWWGLVVQHFFVQISTRCFKT
jgi:hypothetical protein